MCDSSQKSCNINLGFDFALLHVVNIIIHMHVDISENMFFFVPAFWPPILTQTVFLATESGGFEAHSNVGMIKTLVCLYWCAQLKQRFLGTLKSLPQIAKGRLPVYIL